MKKLFLTAFCLLCLASNAFAAQTVLPRKIYFVVWNGCEEACQGFFDAVADARLNADIVLRDAAGDKAKIAKFVKEAKETAPDLLATWGTQVSLEMLGTERDMNSARYVSGIPAVFMVVSHPVESGLVSSMISQGRSVTGVTQTTALSEQLQSARLYFPFKRLGIVYNAAETNASLYAKRLKTYAPMLNFELVERVVPTDENGKPDASALPKLMAEMAENKVDLLYLGADSFLNAHKQAYFDAASAYNLPVLAAYEGAVRNGGALMSFSNRYYTVGWEAGKKAVRVLKDGIAPYDIPVTSPQRFLPVVNMKAAKELSLYPPLTFLQTADLVNAAQDGD